MSDDVVRIVEILQAMRHTDVILKSQVYDWMNSTDENVIGALVHLTVRRPEAINPPLTRTDIDALVKKTFALALASTDSRKSEFALSDYDGARQFARWLRECSEASAQGDVEARERVSSGKAWIEEMYLSASEAARVCIIEGALEHLFEDIRIKDEFSDWADKHDLLEPYERASAWSAWVNGSR